MSIARTLFRSGRAPTITSMTRAIRPNGSEFNISLVTIQCVTEVMNEFFSTQFSDHMMKETDCVKSAQGPLQPAILQIHHILNALPEHVTFASYNILKQCRNLQGNPDKFNNGFRKLETDAEYVERVRRNCEAIAEALNIMKEQGRHVLLFGQEGPILKTKEALDVMHESIKHCTNDKFEIKNPTGLGLFAIKDKVVNASHEGTVFIDGMRVRGHNDLQTTYSLDEGVKVTGVHLEHNNPAAHLETFLDTTMLPDFKYALEDGKSFYSHTIVGDFNLPCEEIQNIIQNRLDRYTHDEKYPNLSWHLSIVSSKDGHRKYDDNGLPVNVTVDHCVCISFERKEQKLEHDAEFANVKKRSPGPNMC